MRFTVLVDNNAQEGLLSEWGLSIYIEAEGRRILLDCGCGGTFAENAERLGIDLAGADCCVLSHAHYDHADGLEDFLAVNKTAPVYLRSCARENCFSRQPGKDARYIGIRQGVMKQNKDRIIPTDGFIKLCENVYLLPHAQKDYTKIAIRSGLYIKDGELLIPENFDHEQSLVIRTGEGLVIFSSCSHTGILNILDEVRAAFPGEHIHAFVGGLHLFRLTPEEVSETAYQLQNNAPDLIFTGHCTGDKAYEILAEALPGCMCCMYSGCTVDMS